MPASLIALLLAIQSTPPEVEFRAELRRIRVSGSMKFDEKPAVGDRVDLTDDLGLRDATVPAMTARITLGADRFSLSADRLLLTGEETLDRERRWNESLFPAGEEVRTEIDLFQGELGYHRLLFKAGEFDMWAGAAARYMRLEAVLRSPSQGRDDDHAISFVPVVRLAVGWAPSPSVRFEGEAEAASLATGDFDVAGGAATVLVAWTLSPSMALRLGWRAETLKLVKDISMERNEFRVRADGLALALEIGW